MSSHAPYVPAPIIKRYILAWMSLDSERTWRDVAHRTGVSERLLYAVRSGERLTVQFDTADTILVALGYQLAWIRDEELSEIYAAA